MRHVQCRTPALAPDPPPHPSVSPCRSPVPRYTLALGRANVRAPDEDAIQIWPVARDAGDTRLVVALAAAPDAAQRVPLQGGQLGSMQDRAPEVIPFSVNLRGERHTYVLLVRDAADGVMHAHGVDGIAGPGTQPALAVPSTCTHSRRSLLSRSFLGT